MKGVEQCFSPHSFSVGQTINMCPKFFLLIVVTIFHPFEAAEKKLEPQTAVHLRFKRELTLKQCWVIRDERNELEEEMLFYRKGFIIVTSIFLAIILCCLVFLILKNVRRQI